MHQAIIFILVMVHWALLVCVLLLEETQVLTYQHPSITACKSQLDHVYMNFDHEWMGYSLPMSYLDHYLIGIFVPYLDNMGLRLWRFPNDLLEDKSFQ